MCEEWMPNLTLSLTGEQYEQLPRNSAYQYDYRHGTALLSPRPKHYHAILKFAGRQLPGPEELSRDVQVRPMQAADQAALPEIFADAFMRVQPFGGLPMERRLAAARLALEKTWQGGDGPWLRQASFTAVHAERNAPLGAVAVTLVPGGDPADAESYRWPETAAVPQDAKGQPHLTWIFVSPLWKAGGIGSALLEKAVRALEKLGYADLWTTFMLGNDASTLWHWRNGFTLAAFPLSRRASRRESRGLRE
jgi:GNAT superfamily N-acetyltransferase